MRRGRGTVLQRGGETIRGAAARGSVRIDVIADDGYACAGSGLVLSSTEGYSGISLAGLSRTERRVGGVLRLEKVTGVRALSGFNPYTSERGVCFGVFGGAR